MKRRIKAKGRRESGPFLPIPTNVLDSENFKKLSATATKLLLDVCTQLRFKRGGAINNGDLAITEKLMKERGWKSRDTLYRARDELKYYGFIQVTRAQRYISQPTLYAITFFAIDECDGKLDVKSTINPPNLWKATRPDWKQKKNRTKNKSLYRNNASVVPINGTKTRESTAFDTA